MNKEIEIPEGYEARIEGNKVIIEQKEGEDERIIKIIKRQMCHGAATPTDEERAMVDAWLEKQKEPHYTKRNALFDRCVENCDPEVMKKVSDEVDEMLQKEQKPALTPERIRPKFAVGDTVCRPMYCDHTIREIYVRCNDPVYVCMNDEGLESHISLSEQDEWERKEQKPAEWSEEDEKMLKDFLHKVEVCDLLTNKENVWIVKKLKSLHPHWKPKRGAD